MCDYSLTSVKSRKAELHDDLIVRNFNTGSRGFSSVSDPTTTVCLLPGTELAFDAPIQGCMLPLTDAEGFPCAPCYTARFAQINKDDPRSHHDQILLSDGRWTMLTHLTEGQTARILQLPAAPKTKEEAEDQRRVEYVG